MTTTRRETLGHWIDGRADDTPGPWSREVTESASSSPRSASQRGRASRGQRTKVMFAFRQILDGHHEELASIVVREHGNVHADALAEVQRGLEIGDFACGLGHLRKGEMSADVSGRVEFGGWKDSLFGDLHVHGPDDVRFCTRGKVVTRRWSAHRGVDLEVPAER